MLNINNKIGLYVDLYELSMAEAYYLEGRQNELSVFDYFFRKNPFGGGYVVFAGLQHLLELISKFQFSDDDIQFLSGHGFNKSFLKYLYNFKFTGNIISVDEGQIVFPQEPVLRVEANIIEAQLIESLTLNILNFESLIATKARRIRSVAGSKKLVDFGLRRAQGFGSINASRAAIIGGMDATSNVLAAKKFGLDISGTQAHSWIQSFDDELQAFRSYAFHKPEQSILLVDTYDTLKSGIPNAIKVAKEMEKSGLRLQGIRLDSGDLAYLSKKARKMLDDQSLGYVKIIASNQLDENIIQSLINQNAPIDGFGIGTRLITAMPDSALDGVYKLSYSASAARMKISENEEKTTLPGIKNIFRVYDKNSSFIADAICLEEEQKINKIYHPVFTYKQSNIEGYEQLPILNKQMTKGKTVQKPRSINDIKSYLNENFKNLPDEHKRFEKPHTYKVGISKKLKDLRSLMIKNSIEKRSNV